MQAKNDIIAQDLANKIRHKIYEPGDFLPSENQLADLYGTSRETIRKALNALLSLGLIQKIRGKGSIVLNLDRYSFPISGVTSFAELNKELGMHATTKVLTLEDRDNLPKQFIEYFPEEESSSGIHLERLRLINGEAEVLDCDYLLNPPIESIPKQVAQASLYQYFEYELGLDISYATKEITVVEVDERIKELLSLSNNLAVLVASRNYLADTTKFQLTLSYHRPDRFKFVDFARRKKIKL
ncbi:GntR family trehalose operon transcriptional repressor [Lactobacillus colini]|uniref:Trehalose operon repressor n=1 Tax=Lactobacillus colini TaxID=1819254 RepID=A0ABS4MFE2_9LACO|nr:trehalose operon repressor [Lactobacillus colini]MBP2058406.1 GntR family trehalose operon transcriptional repressor [Lactobacillus colini]